jgi:hypothetical protein
MPISTSSSSLPTAARLRRKVISASALLALLSACGGGSSGSSSSSGDVGVLPPVRTASVTVIAGSPTDAGYTDGAGLSARFQSPQGITMDAAGNLYVADSLNAIVRKITSGGQVSTFAGKAGSPGAADGTLATARFMEPASIGIDAAGNLLVADWLSARKITTDGIVTTIPGGGSGPMTWVRSEQLWGIAADRAGNIYLSNSTSTRRIAPTGVTTILESVTRDPVFGTPDIARRGITVDTSGGVYVFDLQNTVSRVDTSSRLTTLAGSAGVNAAADGTGTAARFQQVRALTADSQGNLFAADVDRVRKITPAGVVTTVAGKGSNLPLPNDVGSLWGIVADGKGNLYATFGNAVVKITLP